MRRMKFASLVALSALLSAVPIASAASPYYERTGVRDRSCVLRAGTLCIDRSSFEIYEGSVHQQIVDAFNSCGYEARCEGKVVLIGTRDVQPRVRWRAGSRWLNKRYEYDCLRISTRHRGGKACAPYGRSYSTPRYYRPHRFPSRYYRPARHYRKPCRPFHRPRPRRCW